MYPTRPPRPMSPGTGVNPTVPLPPGAQMGPGPSPAFTPPQGAGQFQGGPAPLGAAPALPGVRPFGPGARNPGGMSGGFGPGMAPGGPLQESPVPVSGDPHPNRTARVAAARGRRAEEDRLRQQRRAAKLAQRQAIQAPTQIGQTPDFTQGQAF